MDVRAKKTLFSYAPSVLFWAQDVPYIRPDVRRISRLKKKEMLLNNLNRDMIKPFRSHRGLVG